LTDRAAHFTLEQSLTLLETARESRLNARVVLILATEMS
jgi:hypothetical protein